MKLPAHILGPARVLEIMLTTDSHSISAWRCKANGDIVRTEYDAEYLAKGVTGVTVGGHGTVSKPLDSQVAARVREDGNTFLWSECDGQIVFVRRERLREVMAELAASDIHIQRIEVGLPPAEAARNLFAALRWRDLLRPSAEGSALMLTLVRRIALPVLGLFLCLLAANTALAPRLGARRQALQSELAARECLASTAADATARQRALVDGFGARYTISRAVICDRLAAAVPEGVALTTLLVEPLVKRLEAGKPLLRQERTAVVAGMATTAADVSSFVERLTGQACCRTVRLTNVERERDAERLVFRIEIGL